MILQIRPVAAQHRCLVLYERSCGVFFDLITEALEMLDPDRTIGHLDPEASAAERDEVFGRFITKQLDVLIAHTAVLPKAALRRERAVASLILADMPRGLREYVDYASMIRVSLGSLWRYEPVRSGLHKSALTCARAASR